MEPRDQNVTNLSGEPTEAKINGIETIKSNGIVVPSTQEDDVTVTTAHDVTAASSSDVTAGTSNGGTPVLSDRHEMTFKLMEDAHRDEDGGSEVKDVQSNREAMLETLQDDEDSAPPKEESSGAEKSAFDFDIANSKATEVRPELGDHKPAESSNVPDPGKPRGRNAQIAAAQDSFDSSGSSSPRKSRLLRNKSTSSFKRIFQRHRHTQSASNIRLSNQQQPLSPRPPTASPIADEVFDLTQDADCEDAPVPAHGKSASESDETAASRRRRFSLRDKFASLPAYNRSRSQTAGEESPSPGGGRSGEMLWRRASKKLMGSFSFSRQVSTSGQSPSDESCFSTENKVDSVYQVLKEGIILRSCKDPTTPPGSLQRNPSTESGVSASKSDPNIPGSMARVRDQKEPLSGQKSEPGLGTRQLELRTSSNSLNEEVREESPHPDAQQCKQWLKSQSSKDDSGDGEPTTRGQLKAQQMDRLAAEGNLYVALYKYEAQQRSDLSLKPGDKVVVTNDKDQSWWIGECDKRNGFFPANFVMGIRPTEQIHNCIQPTTLKDLNNREIPLKKHQVLAIRYDWPVSDHNYVYARSPNAEGYVCKEDLKPL